MRKPKESEKRKLLRRLQILRGILIVAGGILLAAAVILLTAFPAADDATDVPPTLVQDQVAEPSGTRPVAETVCDPTEAPAEQESSGVEEPDEENAPTVVETESPSDGDKVNPQMLEETDAAVSETAPSEVPDTAVGTEGSTAPEETLVATETEPSTVDDSGKRASVDIRLCVILLLLGADILGIIATSVMISQLRKQLSVEEGLQAEREALACVTNGDVNGPAMAIRVGKLHNIGARPYQEDSFGVTTLDDGILAVVADGMGGLSGGDKVSQKIVYTMLGYGDSLKPGQMDGVLLGMVKGVNETVNRMLGPSGLYKSGSTLLAVLVRGGGFHWITVGDSHIYFHHRGKLVQLNQEHNRGQELLHKAIRDEISFENVRRDPKKSGLTSFIGMGQLKYVDRSISRIPLEPGDRIILSTDGVFNALPDQAIEAVLNQIPDVQTAASELERLVLSRAIPTQDNFTAIILGV